MHFIALPYYAKSIGYNVVYKTHLRFIGQVGDYTFRSLSFPTSSVIFEKIQSILSKIKRGLTFTTKKYCLREVQVSLPAEVGLATAQMGERPECFFFLSDHVNTVVLYNINPFCTCIGLSGCLIFIYYVQLSKIPIPCRLKCVRQLLPIFWASPFRHTPHLNTRM